MFYVVPTVKANGFNHKNKMKSKSTFMLQKNLIFRITGKISMKFTCTKLMYNCTLELDMPIIKNKSFKNNRVVITLINIGLECYSCSKSRFSSSSREIRLPDYLEMDIDRLSREISMFCPRFMHEEPIKFDSTARSLFFGMSSRNLYHNNVSFEKKKKNFTKNFQRVR